MRFLREIDCWFEHLFLYAQLSHNYPNFPYCSCIEKHSLKVSVSYVNIIACSITWSQVVIFSTTCKLQKYPVVIYMPNNSYMWEISLSVIWSIDDCDTNPDVQCKAGYYYLFVLLFHLAWRKSLLYLLPFTLNSQERPTYNFSLQNKYIDKQTGDENQEIHRIGDISNYCRV